jgi:pimeloyl-ACP methyl ester carboxylesterase
MDAAGVERGVQLGFSVGCQIVLEMMRQFPQRCAGLVLLFGAAGHVLSTTRLPVPAPLLLRLLRDTPDRLFTPLFAAFARLCMQDFSAWGARKLGLIGSCVSAQDIQEMTEHLGVLDPPTFRRMAISAEQHAAFDVLGQLRVPTLIMAGDRDPFAPPEKVGIPAHRAAPGSELVCLPRATHTALLDEPDAIRSLIDRFLARRLPEYEGLSPA